MKKVVLMGNPNVGKSVFFSRLTGANVITSNYPGTTVDFSKGRLCRGKDGHEIIDAPGTYSLEPSNRAEEVALELLEGADLVINVADA
ncbi:MAG: FeoB small GTPase domain-containing protein, partial [Methanolinea sp.]